MMRKQFKNGSVLTTILSKLNAEIITDKAYLSLAQGAQEIKLVNQFQR